jgi:hypothetical protein
VLAELGRNGVGGRLRSGHLHRRLAWETRCEIVFEDQWPDGAGEDDAAFRMIARSRMRTLIRAWRVRHGFAFDRPRLHGTALEQMAEGARSNADFARWAAKIVAIRQCLSSGCHHHRQSTNHRRGAMNDERDPPIEPLDYVGGVAVVVIGDVRVARGMSRRHHSSCPHVQLIYDQKERRLAPAKPPKKPGRRRRPVVPFWVLRPKSRRRTEIRRLGRPKATEQA